MPTNLMPEQPVLPDQSETNRIVGIFMLVLTGFIFRSEIISPLNVAAHHGKEVSISNSILAIPFFFTIAVIFTVLGKRAYKIMGHPRKPSVLGWCITGITFGLGVYLDYWMKCKLSDYGYNF